MKTCSCLFLLLIFQVSPITKYIFFISKGGKSEKSSVYQKNSRPKYPCASCRRNCLLHSGYGFPLECVDRSPHDGVTLPEDVPVIVLSHAYAREGVGEAVLYVDSAAYRRESPAEIGAEFSDFSFEWLPPGPGDYALQVWVYDILGEAGGPATVYVHVGEPLVIEFGDTYTPTLVSPVTFTPTRPL